MLPQNEEDARMYRLYKVTVALAVVLALYAGLYAQAGFPRVSTLFIGASVAAAFTAIILRPL